MASAQQQQDVIVRQDMYGNISVDRYAKALKIVNSDNPNIWKYEVHHIDGVPVHYADLLGDVVLDVSGAQPVEELTRNIHYNVYLELNLKEGAEGFDTPMMFEFTDPMNINGSKTFLHKLQKGEQSVLVGEFVSTPFGSQNVTMKMTDPLMALIMKKGLQVRCMRTTPAGVRA